MNILMLHKRNKIKEEQREVIKYRHFLSPRACSLPSIRIPLVLQTSTLDSTLFIHTPSIIPVFGGHPWHASDLNLALQENKPQGSLFI